MKLSFYAKADALQRVPSFEPAVGQQDRYVGRECKVEGGVASFPATHDPFVCESDSKDGQRLKHLIFRDHDLWAANQETADYCQVPFVDVEFDDGEWVVKETVSAGERESEGDGESESPGEGEPDETTTGEQPPADGNADAPATATKRRRSKSAPS